MAYGKNVPKNYINIFEIAKLEGIPEGTVKCAVSEGLEGIKRMGALSPIGHLFREFEKGSRKSYAILKRHYEYWKETGESPKVSPGRPPKWKNNPEYENLNIPIPKSIYGQFKKIVDNANKIAVTQVTYRDMIYVAIKEFCDRRPELLNGGDSDDEG